MRGSIDPRLGVRVPAVARCVAEVHQLVGLPRGSTAGLLCGRLPEGGLMRRQLKNFLPIVLIALLVQIFAPIGACWAASLAASAPPAGAITCHSGVAQGAGQDDQIDHRAHDGCCAACSVLQTGAPITAPQSSAATAFDRATSQVTWRDFARRLSGPRAASEAQARAPPFLS